MYGFVDYAQRATTSRFGSKLIVAVVLVVCLHKAGCISATPEAYPSQCETWHSDHVTYVREHPDVCP